MHLGIGRDEHDQEGRVITAEFENLFVVNVYVPNAGQILTHMCDDAVKLNATQIGIGNEYIHYL